MDPLLPLVMFRPLYKKNCIGVTVGVTVLMKPIHSVFFNKKVENSAQPQALFSDFLKVYYIRDKNLSLDFLIPTFLLKKTEFICIQ